MRGERIESNRLLFVAPLSEACTTLHTMGMPLSPCRDMQGKVGGTEERCAFILVAQRLIGLLRMIDTLMRCRKYKE